MVIIKSMHAETSATKVMLCSGTNPATTQSRVISAKLGIAARILLFMAGICAKVV